MNTYYTVECKANTLDGRLSEALKRYRDGALFRHPTTGNWNRIDNGFSVSGKNGCIVIDYTQRYNRPGMRLDDSHLKQQPLKSYRMVVSRAGMWLELKSEHNKRKAKVKYSPFNYPIY